MTWHVYAYFPCNSCGVRVGIRRSRYAADRFAKAFSKKNGVATSWRVR